MVLKLGTSTNSQRRPGRLWTSYVRLMYVLCPEESSLDKLKIRVLRGEP